MIRQKVKEIFETTSVMETNKMLGQDWFLLETYHGEKGFVYVLARKG